MPIQAQHIMKKPVTTVDAGMKLTEFARLLSEERISGAPVVDANGRIIGIISRTDLVDHLLEGSAQESEMGGFLSFLGLESPMKEMASGSEEEVWGTVGDIMTSDVETAEPAASLAEVAVKMFENRIHRVVITADDRPVGIITSLDLLGHFPRTAATVPDRATARPAPERRPPASKKGPPRKPPRRKPKARPKARRRK
jgi:CBS domain-containing protein